MWLQLQGELRPDQPCTEKPHFENYVMLYRSRGRKLISLPGKQTLGSQLVLSAALCPGVWGVDGRVAVHVGTVLLRKPVHAVSLQQWENLVNILIALDHHSGRVGAFLQHTLPLRPWASVQVFFSMKREVPCRLFLTTSSLMLLRPCFKRSVFLPPLLATMRVSTFWRALPTKQ